MAPEQHDSTATTDHRADIYSLGVVLYEMLTGERPTDNIEPPSKRVQVDVRIDEIVLRALEKTPELRYQTAAEFRTQVETVAGRQAESPVSSPGVKPTGGAEADEEEPDSSVTGWLWRFVPLVAVVLAFFNPWGGKAWYYFAAGCAMLSVLPAFGFRDRCARKGAQGLPNRGMNRASRAWRSWARAG